MPLPLDPALGLSGAVAAMQQTPDMDRAAGDLSRAAQGLQSVAPSIQSQNVAVQQLAIQGQTATANVTMVVNQLGMQISGLVQAVNQLSAAVRLGAMGPGAPSAFTAPMFAPNAQVAPLAVPAPSSFAPPSVGPMAVNAFGTAGRGLMGAGSFFGGIGAAMTTPFFGAQVFRQPGESPVLGNAGFARSLAVGTGLSVNPQMMRLAGGGMVTELGNERAGQIFGNTILAGGAGLAHLGGAVGGEMLGGALIRGMGLRGLGGLVGGMAAGSLISAPLSMAVGEVMDQVTAQRALGDQFARNASRFMPMGASGGQLRRPGFGERQRFGAAVNRMAIDDLTFNSQDMQEIFAGLTNNDLMRGVQTTDDVIRRMRVAKDTIKSIGRLYGTSIRESTEIMGELQNLGIDPNSMRGRGAIFGAGTLPNARFAMGFAGQFAQAGLSGPAFGVGLMSNAIGTRAMQTGALRAEDIAAVGGKEGAQALVGNALVNFAQSGMGLSTLVAGSRGGQFNMGDVMGLGAQGMLRQAGQRSNAGLLTQISLDPSELQRQFLSNEAGALTVMLTQAKDLARQFERAGVDPRQSMKLAIGQLTQTSGPQLEALVRAISQTPEGLRKQERDRATAVSEAVTSDVLENAAIGARVSRGFSSALAPVSEGVGGAVAGAQQDVGDLVTRARNRIYGVREVTMAAGDINTENLRALQSRGLAAGVAVNDALADMTDADIARSTAGDATRGYVMRQQRDAEKRKRTQNTLMAKQPSDKMLTAAKKSVLSAIADNPQKVEDLKKRFKETTDPTARSAIAEELLNITSRGTYANSSDGTKRAFQMELERATGLDIGAALSGSATTGELTTKALDEVTKAVTELSSITELSEAEVRDWSTKTVDVNGKKMSVMEALMGGGEEFAAARAVVGDRAVQAREGLLGQRWTDLGMSNEEQARGFLKTLNENRGVASAGVQLRGVGTKLAAAMRQSGVSRNMELLTSGGESGVLKFLSQMGSEEIEKLRDTNPELAAILEATGSGAVNKDESAKAMSRFIPKDMIDEVLSDSTISAEESAMLRARAIAGEGVTGSMAIGKNITENQAQLLSQLSQNTNNTAALLERLAVLVDDLEKRTR